MIWILMGILFLIIGWLYVAILVGCSNMTQKKEYKNQTEKFLEENKIILKINNKQFNKKYYDLLLFIKTKYPKKVESCILHRHDIKIDGFYGALKEFGMSTWGNYINISFDEISYSEHCLLMYAYENNVIIHYEDLDSII